MEKLRTPLMVTAVVTVIYGISSLIPSLASAIFGYEIKDPGLALFLGGTLLGLGIVIWGISQDAAKYGGLATYVVVSLVIGILVTLWGWLRGDFGLRTAAIPMVVGVILTGWIWSAKPKM